MFKEPNDFAIEFAERTLQNLKLVNDAQGLFDVTQLVNSLLGLIVFPHERYWSEKAYQGYLQKEYTSLVGQGWPHFPVKYSSFKTRDTLKFRMTRLRNAFAHMRIQFLFDSSNMITGISVWDEWKKVERWRAELEISELREFAERLVNLLSNAPDASGCSPASAR